MKKIAFAALLCALPASITPAYAQGASAPEAKARTAQTAGDDYELQKAKARAPQFESEAELRDQSKLYVGRIVELRGTVKGTFSRADGFSLMLQQTDGTLLVESSNALRGNPLLKAGTFVRALCRVESISSGEPSLSLVNLTDRAEPLALLKNDDDDGIAIAPPSVSAPAPAAILLGQEMDLPPAPGLNADDALPTPRIQATAKLAPSSTNPYYGFTEQHRANYKAFIRRDNPKLTDARAYEIAGAILNAAQTHNLDPRFLCAVVQVESDFDPSCLSSSGAMGLGQLMPFNLKPLGVTNAWDPTDNLLGSAKLLRQNLNTYSQQKDGTLLAVAAYHAGVGAVNRAGMKVPKATTQRYVWKVYYAYRALAPELFQ